MKRKSISTWRWRGLALNWPPGYIAEHDAGCGGVRGPRFTNDVDILADLTPDNLDRFLSGLPKTFFADADEARNAIRLGRSFNVIHMPMAFKFDLFPASAFPIGLQELDRAISLAGAGLADTPVPFVTPEDILLAKLHWYRLGGEVSEV